jgi:hypothetical protein
MKSIIMYNIDGRYGSYAGRDISDDGKWQQIRTDNRADPVCAMLLVPGKTGLLAGFQREKT